MNKQEMIDQIIGQSALFQGAWILERVGNEQWVFRGTKEAFPRLFMLLGDVEYTDTGKVEINVTEDMRLVLHESVEHVQLRIYNKERIEELLGREARKLQVTPESIETVKSWLDEAAKSGVSQLSYLAETLKVFEEK